MSIFTKKIVLSALLIELCRHLSHYAQLPLFAVTGALAPSFGFFARGRESFIVYLLRATLVSAPSAWLLSLPTLFGALYVSESPLFKRGIPLVCMILFLSHPIGLSAWFYTLYWIIPIMLAKQESIFLRALGSTFTTHAVGSVIWVYTHTTTSAYWFSLLSVVWYERLLSALLLTSIYYGIVFLKDIKATPSLQRSIA